MVLTTHARRDQTRSNGLRCDRAGAAWAKPEDRAVPADLQRVQTVFLAAVRHPDSAGRRAVLDRECAGDAELRMKVEALLLAYDERDTHPGNDPAPPSEIKPAETVIASAAPRITEHLGGHIGPYKLLQKLGDGGMGTVYMAEQEVPEATSTRWAWCCTSC